LTKQEEIREGLENLQLFRWDAEVFYLTPTNITRVLSSLHSQGVVIKVERELSEWEDHPFSLPQEELIYGDAQEMLVQSGYVAVEPLMEEKEMDGWEYNQGLYGLEA